MGSKQLQLSTSIQASFGNPDDPDYVFQITGNGDNTIMAVSLSTNAIKMYCPETGSFKGDLLGHTTTISAIEFPDPKSPQLLFSSSADSTIRTWDIRSGKQVAVLKAPEEIWTFSVGGNPGTLIVGGGDGKVFIWDWRSKKLATSLDELHTDPVTKVQFHPLKKETLLTASLDGLINVVDTKASVNGDDFETLNVGTSLANFGVFGKEYDMLWVLTHIETLSIWNLDNQFEAAAFADTRAKASYCWNLPSVNYLTSCHSLPASDMLWLLAGNNDGHLGCFPVSYATSTDVSTPSVGMIGDVGAVLGGGHGGVVRTVWFNNNPASRDQLFCWTGGEDGRLCSWSQNGSTERGSAWVSSNLVMRKASTKARCKPY